MVQLTPQMVQQFNWPQEEWCNWPHWYLQVSICSLAETWLQNAILRRRCLIYNYWCIEIWNNTSADQVTLTLWKLECQFQKLTFTYEKQKKRVCLFTICFCARWHTWKRAVLKRVTQGGSHVFLSAPPSEKSRVVQLTHRFNWPHSPLCTMQLYSPKV